MRLLNGNQLKALNGAVRVLYGAKEDDDFGAILLRAADTLFPGTKISVDEVIFADGQVVHWIDQNYPAGSEEFWTRWPEFSHQHPGVQYVAGGGRRAVVAISDFLSLREFRSLGLYEEIYKPNLIKDQIATVIQLPGSGLGLAISDDKLFRAADNACLTALHPHLLSAYEEHQRRRQMARQLRLAVQLLDVAPEGVLFCSRTGRIDTANRKALGLIAKYFAASRLPGIDLPVGLGKAIRARSVGVLEIPGDDGILQIRWSPGPDAGVFLLLVEARRNHVRESARAHGLSRRESEVAHWLALGKTNDEISRLLGISRHTSRTHVERILAKLGVGTRTAAVAKLMTR